MNGSCRLTLFSYNVYKEDARMKHIIQTLLNPSTDVYRLFLALAHSSEAVVLVWHLFAWLRVSKNHAFQQN